MNPRISIPGTLIGASLFVAGTTGAYIGFLALSAIGQLNRTSCLLLLVAGIIAILYGYLRLNAWQLMPTGWRYRRFLKPFPLVYAICAAASLIGGAIHHPNNHDALSYRVPRVLHWLAEGSWHWIGGADTRMDFSGVGYEVLILPAFAALHSLRTAYLVNIVSYLLLPGLVYRVLTGLGVRNNISALWMWLIPSGSCFVMQAGSLGNDLPGCTLFLASLAFGLRARSDGRIADFWLSILSAALMTAMKASNLPLLLPAAICIGSAIINQPQRFATSCLAGCMALTVSFAPVALKNIRHTGEWTGLPGSPLKLKNPAAGLAGNSVLIGSASLAPAVFPQAERMNIEFESVANGTLRWIKQEFLDFRMTHPQLASEENSGLGLGVTGPLLLAVLCMIRRLQLRRVLSLGGLIFMGCWGALFFFMMNLGNCGTPRLAMPYYAGCIGLLLLLFDSGKIFRSRYWKLASLLTMTLVLPALFCSPSRPLLPMRGIMLSLMDFGLNHPIILRMATVYDVYSQRHDPYQEVRKMLPRDSSRIAFAGTSGDSEYSFWLPLGTRRVVDYQPDLLRKPTDPSTYDAIVASTWGTQDRFGMSPHELAKDLGWKISGTINVHTLASAPPVQWSVLVPIDATTATPGDRQQ
jgi:hypothetical protein